MLRCQSHCCCHFRARKRPAKVGHGSLAVDYGGEAQFLIHIASSPKAGEFIGHPRRRTATREPEKFPRAEHHAGKDACAADEGSTAPKISDGHGSIPHDFCVTAAIQLISTNDSPGRPATATVVRAGPPFGKYVLKTEFMPS